ncbi:hypothetical protein MTR67_039681 [Solanum verrucosum]|uniref:Uncharacterized protein n=1 Tax=Solanum verrucosum TaxID=315347 RepID=A0AAF0UIM0_SOLVR|nr:hypothetical protein MTR67_039681 [Solanum verrucosum]
MGSGVTSDTLIGIGYHVLVHKQFGNPQKASLALGKKDEEISSTRMMIDYGFLVKITVPSPGKPYFELQSLCECLAPSLVGHNLAQHPDGLKELIIGDLSLGMHF